MRFSLSTMWSLATPLGIHRHIHTTTIARQVGRGSFFAYFNLPKSPELDTVKVQRAYYELQRRVHPDQANVQAKEGQEEEGEPKRHTSASPSSTTTNTAATSTDMVANVDESVYANLAYETLRDPFLRCKYLARLSRAEEVKGGPLSPAEEEALMSEDDRRSIEENRRIVGATGESSELSQEFLAEMMLAHETIFAADPEWESGQNTLKPLVAQLGERYDECYSRAREHWKAADYQSFRRCVLEWTYIQNALALAKDRLD